MSTILTLGGRQKAILARVLCTRANIAFWRSPMANIALVSQTWRAMRKKPFYNLFIITLAMQDFRLQCT